MSATVVAPGITYSTYPVDGITSVVTKVQGATNKADGSLCYLADQTNNGNTSRILTFNPSNGDCHILVDSGAGLPDNVMSICLNETEDLLYIGTVDALLYSVSLPGLVITSIADLSGIAHRLQQLALDPTNNRQLLFLDPYNSKGTNIQSYNLDTTANALVGNQKFASFFDCFGSDIITERETGGQNSGGAIYKINRDFGVRTEILAGYDASGRGNGPRYTTPIDSHYGIASDDCTTNIYFTTDAGSGGGLKVAFGSTIATIDTSSAQKNLHMVRSLNKLMAFSATSITVYS